MSLHALAHHMAEKGRGPDSMLVHMSPDEIQSLQALAMANGGSLTINPQTGLPEAGFLDSLLPALAGFALGPAGFGLMSSAMAGLTVGGITALASGDLGKGLMAGLGAYGGAGLGSSLSAAGDAAMMGPPTSAMGLPEGAAVQATSPVGAFDRLQAGAQIAGNAPGDFLKSNYMNLGFAAAPGMSGAFEEEDSSSGVKPHPGYIRVFDDDGNQIEAVKADEWGGRSRIKWGDVPKPKGYAPGGRIEDEYSILPYEPPITTMPVELSPETPPDATAPTEEIKKGVTKWGDVLAPDLTGRDLNDKRSDSEKAQDYLMGKGPNPFTFTSKAPVVDPIKKANEATKEIAETVAEQQRGGSGNNGLGPSAGIASSAGVGFPAGLAPAANTVAQALGDMGLNSLSHAVSSAAMSGAMSGSGAAPGSSTGPNSNATNSGMSNSGGWGSRDAGGGTSGGPSSGGSAAGASARGGMGFGGTGSGVGGDGGSGKGDGGGDGGGDARGGYLAHGQFDQRPRYADGGTTGSGSLDLHVPINIGGEGGGGGGGGGFGGGQYQPVGQGGGFGGGGGGLGGLMPQGSQNDGMMHAAVMPQGGMSQPSPNFLQQQMNSLPGFQAMQKAQQDFTTSDDYKNFQNYAQEYQQQFQPQQQPSAFGGTMGGSRYGMLQGGLTNQLSGMGGTAQNGYMSPGGMGGGGDSYDQYVASNNKRLAEKSQVGSAASMTHDYVGPTMSRDKFKAAQNAPRNPASYFAQGGITALAGGGMHDLGDYSDGGRLLRGPGDGVSDDIPATIGGKQPARLADGEFVVPARIVSEIGNGSTEAGARKLYAMMDRVQKARHKTVGKNKIAANTRAEKYLPA